MIVSIQFIVLLTAVILSSYLSLETLIFPEHKASDLNTIPRLTIVLVRLERRVRRPTRTPVLLRVEDLEQQCFARRHVALVVPAMRRVRSHVPGLEVLP